MRLEIRIAPDLPRVTADDERIQQALSNLVGNAVKFSAKGGTIVLSAEADTETVTFSVADNGIGIAEDELARVFDRYWQSTRTNRQGAGLGLAIAKGLIEGHGGRIWIESRPARGTTVRFTLPVARGE